VKVLEVENLSTHYQLGRETVYAVDNVSFSIDPGETFGLAGESGCGKTTVAKSIMRILPENGLIVGGKIWLDGQEIVNLSEKEVRKIRWRKVSMVFQYAMNAFNPVLRIGDQIMEVIKEKEECTGDVALEKTKALFEEVGLETSRIWDYPHEFSGGMRQRAIIAQALACDPKLMIADEPVTALDVIVQGKILDLLTKLQKKYNLAVLLITHDLSVIAEESDQVGIMYAGSIMEMADVISIFKKPFHPYTAKLIGAFPSIIGEKIKLEFIPGAPPDLTSPPKGCKFHERCPFASSVCKEETPVFRELDKGHFVACHFAGELDLRK
jgi:peptide/nickel transport system ATP-binding protein